jgi:hypothetical protein
LLPIQGVRLFVMSQNAKIQVGEVQIEPNELRITQKYCFLEPYHLQLATTKGRDSIGGHGEGFKVGINLLLRYGIRVSYDMPFCTWNFSLQKIYPPNQNMVVDVVKNQTDRDEMIIKVSGAGVGSLFLEKMDVNFAFGLKILCSSSKGTIYLSTKNSFRGILYCRGLMVNEEPDLKTLSLSVDMDLLISRDRHLIPTALWMLHIPEILSEVLKRVRSSDSQNDSVFKHIFEEYKNFDPSNIQIKVKEILREYCSIKNQNQQVYFVSPDEPKLKEKLESLGKVWVEHIPLADHVNITKLVKDYVFNLPPVSCPINKAPVLKLLLKFTDALQINLKIMNCTIQFFESSPAIADDGPFVYGFGKSTIGPNAFEIRVEVNGIDHSKIGEFTQKCVMEMNAYCKEQRQILYKISELFTRDPEQFVPAVIVEEDSRFQRATSNNQSNQNGSSAKVKRKVNKKPQHEGLDQPPSFDSIPNFSSHVDGGLGLRLEYHLC